MCELDTRYFGQQTLERRPAYGDPITPGGHHCDTLAAAVAQDADVAIVRQIIGPTRDILRQRIYPLGRRSHFNALFCGHDASSRINNCGENALAAGAAPLTAASIFSAKPAS